MSYDVRDLGDGRFELVEMRPVVVGVLTDRRIAERFADYLDSIGATMPDTDPDEGAVAAVWADIAPTQDALATDLPPSPIEALRAAPVPEVTPSAPATAQKETPMGEAIRRVAAGEAVGVVADDVGIPMPRVRAAWAKHCRDNKAKAAMETPEADEECRLCGRAYHSNDSSGGLCARCARDTGGV